MQLRRRPARSRSRIDSARTTEPGRRSTGSTSTTPAQPPGHRGAAEAAAVLARRRRHVRRVRVPVHGEHSPAATCRVGFTAEVDTGVNDVQGEITVEPDRHGRQPGHGPVRHARAASPQPDDRDGHDHRPPEPRRDGEPILAELRPGRPDVPQGQLARRRRERSVGGTGTAPAAAPTVRGTFQGETVSGVRTTSSSSSTSPTRSPRFRSSRRPSTRRRTLVPRARLDRVVHDHVPAHGGRQGPHRPDPRLGRSPSGNRTRAIYCGNSPGQGAAALDERDPRRLRQAISRSNTRRTRARRRRSRRRNPWDCVQIEQGQQDRRSSRASRTASPARPTTGSTAAHSARRRPALGVHHPHRLRAYVRGANNDWLPIEGLLRVYVTGWDGSGTRLQLQTTTTRRAATTARAPSSGATSSSRSRSTRR